MEEFVDNYIQNNEYDSADEDWSDFMDRLENALQEQFGERNVSYISVGDYDDGYNSVDIANSLLSFAKRHKILGFEAFYNDRYDTTFVIIKYAPIIAEIQNG